MSELHFVPTETIEQSLDGLSKGIDILIAQRDTLLSACLAVVAELPETWGDLVRDGYVTLTVNERDIDAVLSAIQKAAG